MIIFKLISIFHRSHGSQTRTDKLRLLPRAVRLLQLRSAKMNYLEFANEFFEISSEESGIQPRHHMSCTRGRVLADLPYNVSCRLWFAPFGQGLMDKNCFKISAILHHGGDFGKARMIISCSVHLRIKDILGKKQKALKNPCVHNRQTGKEASEKFSHDYPDRKPSIINHNTYPNPMSNCKIRIRGIEPRAIA